MDLKPKEKAVLKMIEEDFSYENYFFKKVTNLKWFFPLKEKGYFSPDNAPGVKPAEKEGYYVPQWNVLPYLEQVSKQVNVQGNEKYINELRLIIIEISKYKDSKGQHIDNYRTWRYFVKILLNIPNNKIPMEIIELIPIWLNSKFDTMLPGSQIAIKLLPKFLTDDLDDIKKAEKIIDYITLVKTPPASEEKKRDLKKDKKIKIVIDSYILKEVFEKYSEDIGKKCSEKVIKDLVEKIKKLLKRKEEGTYNSFYEELDYLDKPLDMLTFALKRILKAKAKSDINTTQKILKIFFKDDYLYFPKMALYVIGNDLDEYREFFWETLNADSNDLILKNTSSFGDELKHILENLKQLTEKQREILKNKIEDSAKLEDFKEDQELYLALHKQKFYKALSHEQYFKKLYDEIKNVTKYDIELRSAIGKVEVSSGLGLSPITKEEILQISNKELAEFLSTFRTTDYWKGPSVNGLSNILKEVVKENPEKFNNDLKPFLETGYLYIYDILWGIRDAWENKKMFDWGKLFAFIEQYITTEGFWNDKYIIKGDDWKANHFWVLGIVGEIIKKGIIEESRSFPEKHYQKAQEIIFQIIDKMVSSKKELLESRSERNDYLTYALNSTFGKISEALFMLAYRIKKCEQKAKNKQSVSWEINIKNKYEELLKNEIIESYVWFGRYLPIFYLLLDKKWTEKQINQISSKKEQIWEAFMQGYLNSNNKINRDLYRLMQLHYEKAIDYEFKEKHSSEKFVQYICLAYLQGIEKIEDENGLFRKILDKWNLLQIKEIIGWFWMQRDFIMGSVEEKKKPEETGEMEKMRGLIIDFWRWVYQNKYKEKEKLKEEDKEILSELSKLTVFLEKIDDESYEWLSLSALYIHVDFNAPFFLKYLNNLKDKDKKAGEYVGKIFLKILENLTPDYDQKDIRSIVEYFYTSDLINYADDICDKYAKKGFEFLRDIYEKYH